MQQLTSTQVNQIHGGSIKPSHWLPASAFGATLGAACYVISSFSPNPLSSYAAIGIGALIGATYAASYEFLHDYGY